MVVAFERYEARSGDEARDQLDFVFVQVKLTLVEITVHIRIGEEDFCCAAFDDDVEDVGTLEFVERLRRKDHRGIVFAPGLQGLDDIPLDAGVLEEHPGLVDEERFEHRGDLAVGDDRVGPVQDVEEQWFQEFRILAHVLKVEALKRRERNAIFCVVEEESELTAACPFG